MSYHRKYTPFVNLTGKRYERLKVIRRVENNKGRLMWLCKCDCGVQKIIRGDNLKEKLTKSCGCYHSEQIRGRPYEWIFKLLKRSSKHSSHSCELIYEDILGFVEIGVCHYCGDKIEWMPHETRGCRWAYYLDRKDNSVGYTWDNCVVCCIECNRIKGNRFTYDEMMLLSHVLFKIRADRIKS